MDPLDLLIEDSDKPKVDPNAGARSLVVEFLNLAKRFTEDAESGNGNPAYAAGKAIAYFRATEKLAKVSYPKALELPVFKKMLDRLTPLSIKHREAPPSKTVTVQHKADPDKLKVEEHKILVLEAKEEARKSDTDKLDVRGLPNEKMIVTSDIAKALTNGLGYSAFEARRRAEAVYKPGVDLEELISEACRVNA